VEVHILTRVTAKKKKITANVNRAKYYGLRNDNNGSHMSNLIVLTYDFSVANSPTRKVTSYRHVQIFMSDGPNPLT
jgi:hypothetical protein